MNVRMLPLTKRCVMQDIELDTSHVHLYIHDIALQHTNQVNNTKFMNVPMLPLTKGWVIYLV